MKRVLGKLLVAIAALGVIGYLFIQSVRNTRAEPYTVRAMHLQNWSLAMDLGDSPASAVLALRPPTELASTLFRQLFTRHAESFNGPSVPSVPLLLQDEFTRSFAATTPLSELLETARTSGIENASFTARCMAYRRDAAPGVTRQLYFLVFDAPAFVNLRETLGRKAAAGNGFDAGALSPVMFVAASDTNFSGWLPVRVAEGDCIAPIAVVD
jgi:hypothetical protein